MGILMISRLILDPIGISDKVTAEMLLRTQRVFGVVVCRLMMEVQVGHGQRSSKQRLVSAVRCIFCPFCVVVPDLPISFP
jgi:hypothetical protein